MDPTRYTFRLQNDQGLYPKLWKWGFTSRMELPLHLLPLYSPQIPQPSEADFKGVQEGVSVERDMCERGSSVAHKQAPWTSTAAVLDIAPGSNHPEQREKNMIYIYGL